MPKVTAPFLSQSASGSVAGSLTARATPSGAVMSAKRIRGTPFPQGNSENIKRRAWWTRGNAFKIAAAFRPMLEDTVGQWLFWDDERADQTMRGGIEYLARTGDGNLGLRPSKSRLSFYSQQSLINLISLEVDRYEDNAAAIDEAVLNFIDEAGNFQLNVFDLYKIVNGYEDAFVSRRDISKIGLWWIWSRILLDWYSVRLPYAFFGGVVFELPAPRNTILNPIYPFLSGAKHRDRPTPTPMRCALSGEEQLENMIALRDRMLHRA